MISRYFQNLLNDKATSAIRNRMKRFGIVMLGFCCILASGCNAAKNTVKKVKFLAEIQQKIKEDTRTFREMRMGLNFALTDEQKKDRAFYHALKRYAYPSRLDDIRQLLQEGQDPNRCYGECGWQESNPLLLFYELCYDTYYKQVNHIPIPDPTPDVELLNILIEYGADITLYPYIYIMVYEAGNETLKNCGYDEKIGYVRDSNRILKAFLEKGADVNAKGNAETLDWRTYNDFLTYEEFQDLCKAKEATTPLYEAIKKGMLWESQVDLLLEYGAALDESCLDAARLSGDDAMIEKVENLLKAASI